MAYTYNVTTDRGKVRFLTRDITSVSSPTKGTDYVFDDAEIDEALSMNSDDVWAAAADACRALAADEILGSIRINLSGFTLDRSKVSDYWSNLADKYEKKSKEGGLVEFVDSFDYQISQAGIDESEYVGDII